MRTGFPANQGALDLGNCGGVPAIAGRIADCGLKLDPQSAIPNPQLWLPPAFLAVAIFALAALWRERFPGSAWPLLRAHTLLNNLHTVMGQTPLVLFYPGRYDGQSLRLFGKLKNTNYYRAFKLVP